MTDIPKGNQPANNEVERMKKRYDVSLDTRKLEIELFWKRSLFFWGFIASSFIAFAAFSGAKTDNLHLKSLIALFGLVCSFCWTLANRGSKYWQENWESQVDEIEDKITGPLFKTPAPIQKNKFWWFRARKFSVSKLTISLSDYVTIVWLGISVYCISQLSIFKSVCWPCYFDKDSLIFYFSIFTLSWLVITFSYARTTERKNGGA